MTAADEAGGFSRLLRAFSCAALDQRLSGVLLFDVPTDLLDGVRELFAAVMAERGSDAASVPVPVWLGASTREDDLWSQIRLRAEGGGLWFSTLLGDLVEADPAGQDRVVHVRDLAVLSMPAARAAVTLLGAEVASVERHGVSEVWRPRAAWLAFCQTEDAGQVSQHLLDRFPVRLVLQDLTLPPDPVGVWRIGSARAALAAALDRSSVRRGAGPAPDDDTLRLVIELTGEAGGERRALGLARLARALARLGADQVTTREHVTAAADLIGLPSVAGPVEPTESAAPWPLQKSGDADSPSAEQPAEERPRPGTEERTVGVAGLGPAEALGPLSALDGQDLKLPYPEDVVEPLREYASLRGAWRRTARPRSERGAVLGIRPARDLGDLALVPTVIEAAKNQALPGRGRAGDRLTITPRDLRGYERAAEPERLLVLLLDHTCRADWEWQETLEPYLGWAYVARSRVVVVQVGAGDAPDELRAEAFSARNVLDPRLTVALHRRPGRATPLAHGLLLANQLVRRAFQQQPAPITETWLVAVTDGRGNVPLDYSLTGRLDGPAGRRGVEDALGQAVKLSALGQMRLRSIVVDVGARPYAGLPFDLAEAMGGVVAAGPRTTLDDRRRLTVFPDHGREPDRAS
ncbi:hypothetical protein [Streptomyces sp. CA-111067]|uniref:hypothetical protein n=1 Tax=Streptomyces sp. CA-111067 TaxID=3240046 RepID=UPI003D9894F6